MKELDGFKVVYVDPKTKKMTSCWAGNKKADMTRTSGKRVEYEFRKETCRPKDAGPLACFALYANAMEFIRFNVNVSVSVHWVIMKCKYVKSKDGYLWGNNTILADWNLPSGSVLADSVTILERAFDESTNTR